MSLQLDDLGLLDAPEPGDNGKPLNLPLDSIDEDPSQPRQEFDEESLRELAETIAQRGVKQPISVRPHPDQPNRWMLNFGARRLRASRLAGKVDIPAFVDLAADSYDQVIENEQREPLKPLELALFVQRRVACGESQADIARRLGKSRQYITFATAMIDAPDWLITAYRDGRCRGLTELYELRKLHGQNPSHVEEVVAEGKPINRERIAALREEVRGGRPSDLPLPEEPVGHADVPLQRRNDQPARSRHKASALHVEFDGVRYELIVDDAPSDEGLVFIRPIGGGPRRVVSASQVKLLGFLR
jgi:ParB family transcriptional regulator, chromosome partitioning protein